MVPLVYDPESLTVTREGLAFLADVVRQAGRIALDYFAPGAPTLAAVDTKSGGSPVTEADLRVNGFLESRLREHFPDAAWLSEESVDDLSRLVKPLVVVVDPIDGTRGFVAGDPRWTVCVALVADERPIAGVVHAPALNETYTAARGAGARLNDRPITVAKRPSLEGARAAGPKPMAQALAAAGLPLDLVRPKIPSLAYRLVQVARGALDVALASGDSHDWDIAAADLIVDEAGARVSALDGAPIRYNQPSLRHGRLFAAAREMHPCLLAAAELAARQPIVPPH